MKSMHFPHTADIDASGKGCPLIRMFKKMTDLWNDEDLHHRKDTANKTIKT